MLSHRPDIERQLDRISASDEFRKCPQLFRFLRFAVAEAMSGRDGGSKRAGDRHRNLRTPCRLRCRPIRWCASKPGGYAPNWPNTMPMRVRTIFGKPRLPKGRQVRSMFPERETACGRKAFGGQRLLRHTICDGLTTRLIARLASCQQVRVFQPRHGGEQSDVEMILDGKVRQAGARFRCDSQLVSSSDGLHVWAGSFDCGDSDAFAVEDEFAGQIARAVCEAFLSASPTMRA